MSKFRSVFSWGILVLATCLFISHLPVVVPHAAAATPVTTTGWTKETAIDADGIASGNFTDAVQFSSSLEVARHSLSGHAWKLDNSTRTTTPGNTAVPAGTKVYMRYIDADGAVSPFYVAKTVNGFPGGEAGGDGTYAFKLPTWTDAAGTVHGWAASAGQKYDIWIDPYDDPDTGARLSMMRVVGDYLPNFANLSGALGAVQNLGVSMQRTGIFMYEAPQSYMTSPNPTVDNEGPVTNPATTLTTKNSISGWVWFETGAGDRANSATGPNYNGHLGDVVATGYKVVATILTPAGDAAVKAILDQDNSAQPRLVKELLTAHPEYIQKTVSAPAQSDGRYSIRFGNDQPLSSHIYMYVEDPAGQVVPSYSAFTAPVFRAPNSRLFLTPQPVPGYNGLNGNWYNVHFAITAPTRPTIRVTNFDTTTRPAKPGSVAIPAVTGALSPVENKVEWRDTNGNVLKTCPISNPAEAASCTYEVPANLDKPTIYTVALVSGGNTVDADSFIAIPPSQADTNNPGYDPKSTAPGTPVTVPQTGDTELPEGTTCTLGAVPDGWTATIDATSCAVTATPPATAPNGARADIPVTFTYPDKSVDTATATVNVVRPTDASGNNPSYDPATTTPGTAVTLPQTGDTDMPTGTTCALGAVPDGWTATIDATSCAVTVTPPANASPGATASIPVTFTYPDGSTDVTPAVTTVKAPPHNDTNNPGYDPGTTNPGVAVTVPQTGDPNLPTGTTCALGAVPTGWTVTIDATTCAVTATPPADAAPGTKVDIPVTFTYPDGTTDNANVPITVTAPGTPPTDAESNTPGYNPANTAPATPVTVPQTGDTDMPTGTTCALGAVPAGWTATIDATTCAVTVTPPADAPNGAHADIPVTFTYPDKSTDTAPVTVTVTRPSDADTNTPGYDPGSTKPGVPVTVPQTGDTDLPTGTTCALGTIPAGWTVTIDPVTCAVTATPPAGATPGTKVDIPVTFTYPDGTTDNANVPVTVTDPGTPPSDADANDPGYNPGSTKPGVPVTVPQTGDPDLPAGTTCTVGTIPAGWTVTIDPVTCAVTATPPADATPGTKVDIPVTFTYPDKSTDTANVPVTVTRPSDADSNNPGYDPTSTKPGKPVTVPQTGDTDLPTGTTCALGTIPAGWTATIDATTCAVTATPPADAAPGSMVDIPVIFTYPDGTTDNANVTITVEPPSDADANTPGYTPATTAPGTAVTVPQTGDTDMPAATKCTLGTVPAGWTATIDATTCAVTVTPPADAPNGARVEIPVTFTYPDDSTDIAPVTVTVNRPSDADANNPGYDPGSTKPGTPVTVPQTGDPDLPAGTTCTLGTIPAGWTATIDPVTCAVTVTPPADATPGSKVDIPVTFTYPDKSTDTANVPVTVTDPGTPPSDADANNPGYDPGSTKPGTPVTVPQTGDPDLPAGTTCTVGKVPAGWTATIDPVTCAVTVTPPADATPGSKVDIPVTFTYPDKSTDTANVPVTVTDPGTPPSDADANNPGYNPALTKPGVPVTVPQTGDPDLPAGTTCTVGKVPAGWTATIDPVTCAVTVTPPPNTAPGSQVSVPVTFTYPDGSTDVVTAPIEVTGSDIPPSDADANNPGYDPGSTKPGKPVTVPQTGDPDLPAGTTCTLGTIPAGWTATIDLTTCKVTVTPPASAKPGDKADIPVVFTYPDKSADVATVTVKVTKPSGSALPWTGVDGTAMLWLGVGAVVLLAAGGGLLLVRRRNEETQR